MFYTLQKVYVWIVEFWLIRAPKQFYKCSVYVCCHSLVFCLLLNIVTMHNNPALLTVWCNYENFDIEPLPILQNICGLIDSMLQNALWPQLYLVRCWQPLHQLIHEICLNMTDNEVLCPDTGSVIYSLVEEKTTCIDCGCSFAGMAELEDNMIKSLVLPWFH